MHSSISSCSIEMPVQAILPGNLGNKLRKATLRGEVRYQKEAKYSNLPTNSQPGRRRDLPGKPVSSLFSRPLAVVS